MQDELFSGHAVSCKCKLCALIFDNVPRPLFFNLLILSQSWQGKSARTSSQYHTTYPAMAPRQLLLFTLQAVVVKATLDNAVNAIFKRQAPAACSTWEFAISYCKSASPGFVSLPATDQVPCLCYNEVGTTIEWVPDAFDNAVDQCAAWALTADTADYTVVDSWAGICTDVGNIYAAPGSTAVVSGPVSTPKPTATSSIAAATTAAPSGSILPGCTIFDNVLNSCTSATPNILSLDYGSIAACFCYTSTTSWIPNRFDSAALSCANAIETAHPSDYSTFYSDFVGLCTAVGDVVNSPVVTTTVLPKTSPKTTARTTTPAITPVPTTVAIGGGGGGGGGSPATSTIVSKTNGAPRLMAYESSMKILGSSWLLVTLAFALL